MTTKKPQKIRCSSAPRIWICPPSRQPPRVRYNPESPYSASGTASHKVQEAIILDRPFSVGEIAAEHDVDPDELEQNATRFRRVWANIAEHFPEPETEVPLESERFRGTADVVSGNSAVADPKYGYAGKNYYIQLMAYADALVTERGFPESGLVRAFQVDVQSEQIFETQITEPGLVSWRERWDQRMKVRDYSPSSECTYCPRRVSCPTLTNEFRAVAQTVGLGADDFDPSTLDRAKMAEIRPIVSMLEKLLDGYKRSFKAAIESEGPIESPNEGKEYFLRSSGVMTRIRFAGLAKTLAPYLPKEEVPEILDVKAGVLKKKLGKRWPEAKADLVLAGILTETEKSPAVAERRKKETKK